MSATPSLIWGDVVVKRLRVPRERVRDFWRARIAGASMAEAAAVAGVSVAGAGKWVADCGGVIEDLRERSGARMGLKDRMRIEVGLEQEQAPTQIAAALGRHRSTVYREIARNKDLSAHSPEHLAAVAAELNGRPRQTLNWDTPAERLHALLSDPHQPTGVAPTP